MGVSDTFLQALLNERVLLPDPSSSHSRQRLEFVQRVREAVTSRL